MPIWNEKEHFLTDTEPIIGLGNEEVWNGWYFTPEKFKKAVTRLVKGKKIKEANILCTGRKDLKLVLDNGIVLKADIEFKEIPKPIYKRLKRLSRRLRSRV